MGISDEIDDFMILALQADYILQIPIVHIMDSALMIDLYHQM